MAKKQKQIKMDRSRSKPRANRTTPLGKLVKVTKKRHGHCSGGKRSPTYISWRAMLVRCGNPSHSSYPNYGGRGIKVCLRWRNFRAFLADMGERPAGMTLDRIDVNQGYRPGNVRWADAKTQAQNKRKAA